MRHNQRIITIFISLFLIGTLSIVQVAAREAQPVITKQAQKSDQGEVLWNENPHPQFTYINIVIQVAVNIANRIAKAIMKIKQREMIVAMIIKVSHMSRGMSDTASSGSQLARVAKLLQQPEVDYKVYLEAALEVAKARKQTEENLKGAAENREAAAREADAAAERIYKYNNSRGGDDFKSVAENLVLQDAAVQMNTYVQSVQKETKDMNAVSAVLDQVEGQGGAPKRTASSGLFNSTFTANETPAVTADMLKNTTKEQFASSGDAFAASSEAHEIAARATDAFTEAGNAYVKYLEEKGLSEHPAGDAKADELRAQMEVLANGLVEPYARIDQTSVDANTQLNSALGLAGAPSE